MKTFYKTLMLGVFMTVVAVVSPTFAQDVCTDIEANEALYKKYLENYKGDITKETVAARETAVAAAKEYVEKYANCADYAPQVTYLKKKGPELDELIKKVKLDWEAIARADRFNKAVPTGNAAEIYASGEDVLKYNPDQIDVILVLATVGLDEAADKKNDTFNNKAIDYAKLAIKKIDESAKSDKYGAFGYVYNTKENAIGWMNYTIGYIEFYRQKKEESGLNYLYKSTQVNSDTKNRAFIYAAIGDTFVGPADKLRQEIIEILKKEEKETFESKSKLALSKGYADRAIEAYAKAYEIEKANMAKETDAAKKAASQKYMDGLFTSLKVLYKFRYDTVEKPLAETELVQQLNSHIASVANKPLTSPTAEVKPVDPPTEEEETTDTTTTSSTTTTTTTPAKTGTNGTTDKTTTKPKQR